MLPFMKKVSEDKISADGSGHLMRDDKDFDPLEVVAEDMLFAFEQKDSKALAAAFRAGFELLETEPHEEYNGNR